MVLRNCYWYLFTDTLYYRIGDHLLFCLYACELLCRVQKGDGQVFLLFISLLVPHAAFHIVPWPSWHSIFICSPVLMFLLLPLIYLLLFFIYCYIIIIISLIGIEWELFIPQVWCSYGASSEVYENVIRQGIESGIPCTRVKHLRWNSLCLFVSVFCFVVVPGTHTFVQAYKCCMHTKKRLDTTPKCLELQIFGF